MAEEDGKMQEFTPEMLMGLISSRRETFAQMMEDIKDQGYQVIDLREEAGFTARLAIKKPLEGKRGMFIVCAGGGFMFKSWNEALPVAEFFYEKGINVSILDYHVNEPSAQLEVSGSPGMRMAGEDGLQAIRYLRANAEALGIDPDHIAIGGFSAGGMLTGYASTKFDYGDPEADDPLKRVSSRPDAALVLYGAFSSTTSMPGGPGGMTRQQIADAVDMDPIRNIRTDCPPMFVFQTHEDDPRIALYFCYELAVHGVPYEVHTFERGPHGCGLYNGKDETPDEPHTAMWAGLAADWLKMHGFC